MSEDVPVPGKSFPSSWLEQRLAAVSDTRLVLLVARCCSFWPPGRCCWWRCRRFQDLPNHVATAHIIAHPELYPAVRLQRPLQVELPAHALVLPAGRPRPLRRARAFTAIVLAANALALPRLRASLSPAAAPLPVAMLFVWPLVHSFCVVDGLLELRVRLRAVADSADGARSATGAPHRRRAAWGSPRSRAWSGTRTRSRSPWWARWSRCTPPPARPGGHESTAGVALLLPLVPAGAAVARGRAQQHLVKAEHASARRRHVLLSRIRGRSSRTSGATSPARSPGWAA